MELLKTLQNPPGLCLTQDPNIPYGNPTRKQPDLLVCHRQQEAQHPSAAALAVFPWFAYSLQSKSHPVQTAEPGCSTP